MGNSSSHATKGRKCRSLPNSPEARRQLPSPYCKTAAGSGGGIGGSSAIPLPGSALPARRCPPDKVRPLPPTPGGHPGIPGVARQAGAPSESSSRSESPQGGNGSLIPRIPHSSSRPSSIASIPGSKIPSTNSSYTTGQIPNGQIPNGNAGGNNGKYSMLDKLKLFNKDKTPERSKTQISKRTSSSSGFSSARSERSDSSLSLNDSVNGTTGLRVPGSMQVKQKSGLDTLNKDNKSAKTKNVTIKNDKNEKNIAKPAAKVEKAQNKVDKTKKCEENKIVSKASNGPTKVAQPLSPSTDDGKSKIPNSKLVDTRLKSNSQLRLSMERPLSEHRTLQPPKIMVNQPNTGIPKPMAAIKGTAKPKEDKMKDEKLKDTSPMKNNAEDESPVKPLKQTLIVSPMPVAKEIFSGSMTDSLNSGSNHSAQNSNSSESSVIYRPSSESGASDAFVNRNSGEPNHHKQVIPNRKIERADYMPDVIAEAEYEMNEVNELKNQINAHDQMLKPLSENKSRHQRPTQNHDVEDCDNNSLGHNSETVLPMRPLLRGYAPGQSQGRRNPHGQSSQDHCNGGYLSDGDMLRSSNGNGHSDGYMSEGGATLYGRRVNYDHRSGQVSGAVRMEGPGGGAPLVYRVVGGSKGRPKAEPESSQRRTQAGGHNGTNNPTSNNDQWRKYTDVGTLPQTPPSPTNGRKNGRSNNGPGSPGQGRRSSNGQTGPQQQLQQQQQQHSNRQQQNNGSSRVKGVPQSFGYVKRGGSSSHHASSPSGNGVQMQPGQGQGRTAQVSAVPRSRLKVSGGTQTCTADLQSKPGQGNLMQQQQQGANASKSYSLTGASASQLSQSVRERLALGSQSLPKPGSPEFQHLFQAHRIANRGMKITDGSLSDTQAYAEVKSEYGSPYASWLKHSNTYGAGGVRLSECDSLESLSQHRTSIGSSGGGPMVGHSPSLMGLGGHMSGNRASSQHRDAHSPRLNRSNSIRSTKSEKLYPSTLSRVPDPSDCEPYYCLPVGSQHHGQHMGQHHPTHHGTLGPWASQPTSPTPQNRSGPGGGPLMMGPLSPTIARGYTKKNDDAHGSAASLLSAGSSLYGGLGGNGAGNQAAAEERRASEVRRLKRELIDARDQVLSLTSQLSTNAHVVSAFEQSLQNMTQRLQQLTVTAERKDSEVTEMRQTIELLRKQSVQAGLTSAHMISMGVPQNGVTPPTAGNPALTTQGNVTCSSRPNMTRHLSTDSMSSLNSLSSSCSAQDKKKKKGWLRSSFTKAFSRNAKISKTSRHPSSDCTTDGPVDPNGAHLSDSPRSPSRSPAKSANQPQASSTPNNGNVNGHQLQHQQVQTTPEQEAAKRTEDSQLEELRKQLREKDLVLTDIRLEALTSAHQLESLKDTVIKMRTEMMNLKQNNERLQRLVTSRSLAGSEVSLGGSVASSSDPRRCSAADGLALRPSMELPHYLSETDEESAGLMPCDPPEPAESPPMNGSGAVQDPDRDQSDQSSSSPDQSSGTSPDREHIRSGTTTTDAGGEMEGKRIAICVYLGQPDSFLRYLDEIGALNHGGHEHYITAENNHDSDFYKNHQQTYQQSSSAEEFTISYTRISGKTTWQNLDDVVRKTFRDYLSKVDPGSNLGLNTDSITSYHLGEAKRGPDTGLPELLPCGYIVGRVRALYICLQGVGGLAFDSLIPRSIVNRYVSLLSEHHRLILCGPRGTGKSYLARRLAEFLVARSGHANPNEAIATFHVDHKSGSAGELRQYLCHVAEIAASSAMSSDGGSLPEVIILDDLHNAGAGALADAFGGLLSVSSGNAGNGENGRGVLPRIIGTMSQATCNTTNLQLHHNFRWVLTANHMEPVKGFLARYLRRHVYSLELRTGVVQSELSRVLQWLPAVWSHVNRFLEAHSSSDVTLGPGLFLQCPLDVKRSQVWFTNIWNYKLAPFIVEAVREGVALYGRRGGAWQDPSVFLRDTYPWATTLPGSGAGNTCGVGPAALRRVTADDVGLANETPLNSELGDAENGDHTNGEIQDPLSNMLMRLQEAANYSGNQSNDSDSASVDSNMTHDSSAGVD